MAEFNKIIKEKNISYAKALNEVKRKLIKGEIDAHWTSPYYWALFVFYGQK